MAQKWGRGGHGYQEYDESDGEYDEDKEGTTYSRDKGDKPEKIKIDTDKPVIEIDAGTGKPVDEAEKLITTLKQTNIQALPVAKQKRETETEAISKIAGGDKTKGSCSSVAIAFIGRLYGYDVLDYRGGASQNFFSHASSIEQIGKTINGSKTVKDYNDFNAFKTLTADIKEKKNYYIGIGSHAAIIKKIGDKFKYLELQSPVDNGWKDLTYNELKKRFGCKTRHRYFGYTFERRATIIDCAEMGKAKHLNEILAYINTQGDRQQKGDDGSVK